MNGRANISATLAGLLLTAALLLPSCTKTRTVSDTDPQEIAMRLIETKATDLMDVDASFGLFAYVSDVTGTWAEAWADASRKTYLEDVAFANINETDSEPWVGCDFSGESKTPHPYYYPLSGSLLFAGYSPYRTQSGNVIQGVSYVSIPSDPYNPFLQIKISQSTTPAQMVDLLYFDPADINSGNSVQKSGNALPVVFNHAMSMVVFNIYHHYHDVQAVLHECVFDATFFSGVDRGWLPKTDDANNPVRDLQELFPNNPETAKVTINGIEYTHESASLYMIPQFTNGHFDTMGSQVGGDIVLEITVTDRIPKTETLNESDYLETSGKVEVVLKNHTAQWEIGKKYTYDITIDKPVEFGAPVVASVETLVIEL